MRVRAVCVRKDFPWDGIRACALIRPLTAPLIRRSLTCTRRLSRTRREAANPHAYYTCDVPKPKVIVSSDRSCL